MPWKRIVQVAAVAVYALFWLEVSFRWLGVEYPVFGGVSTAGKLALAALLSVAVGAAIASWWAPAVGLVFVAAMLVPERCVRVSSSADSVIYACSVATPGVAAVAIAVTTPLVLLGVAGTKTVRRMHARGARAGSIPA